VTRRCGRRNSASTSDGTAHARTEASASLRTEKRKCASGRPTCGNVRPTSEERHKSSSAPLREIGKDWVRVGVNVFDAELTCCRRQHEGMDMCDKEKLVEPAIGLFTAMYSAREEAHFKEAYDLCMEVPDMFPKAFTFVQKRPDGKVVSSRRKLFGPLIEVAKQSIDSGSMGQAKARGVLVADTAGYGKQLSMSDLAKTRGTTKGTVHGADPMATSTTAEQVSVEIKN
jgi:hypothetical protein